LIGEGSWSKKISNICEISPKGWEVEVISSRSFASMESESIGFREFCENFDLIWITTTPENQIVHLGQLSNSKVKVILEKPIITKETDILTLRQILNHRQCKVYLSQPWTFSMLWKEAKGILLKMQGSLNIQIERGGDLLRSTFTPEIDWAPHDLYLLYDYAQDLGEKRSQLSLTSRSLEDRSILLKFLLDANVKIALKAGYRHRRIASWIVYSGDVEVLNINFQSSELIDNTVLPTMRREFMNDDPIINMLDSYKDNNPVIDLEKIFELYGHLVK
jgi:hypothetical protein